MMRERITILSMVILATLLHTSSLTADASWPSNHSTVYVAARFPETHPAMVAGNKPPDLPALAPCTPVEIYSSGAFVILTDMDNGTQRWLARAKKEWGPLIYGSKEACESAVKAHGLPRVSGYVGETNHANTFRTIPTSDDGASEQKK
jgi:hypothetical protein